MQFLLKKYKMQLLYLVFGIATTAINVAVYNLCYYQFSESNVLSNIISWVVSVLFAYITNKIWVFASRERRFFFVLKELLLFTAGRMLTGIFDTGIMYLTVDVLKFVAWQCKIVSNIVVIISNYIIGKIIFRNGSVKDDDKKN